MRIAVDPRTGAILTYETGEAPERAVDNYGRDVLGPLRAWDGWLYEDRRGDSVVLEFGRVWRSDARLVLVADTNHIKMKTRLFVEVWNGTAWELADAMHHRMRFAEDVIDLSPYVPTDDLRVRLRGASWFAVDQVGLDTSSPKDVFLQSVPLLEATHSSGQNVLFALGYPDGVYAELVPGDSIRLTFPVPPVHGKSRSFVFESFGHYVHRYQPLQGTDVAISGLNVSFEAVIPSAPLGKYWDMEIVELVWDLGDGSPTVSGLTHMHVYAVPGEYMIRIQVKYAGGHVKWYERTIIVS